MARKEKQMKNESVADDNAASIAMKPTNKLQAMGMAVNLMGIMPDDMAINCFDQMVQQMTAGGESIPDHFAAQNAAGIQMKPSDAAPFAPAIQEAITEIFGDDKTLSEDFKTKAYTLFESAVNARVAGERATMSEELAEAFDEQLSETVEGLIENLDQYITYVAEEWKKDNEVAIESTLRTEMSEDFIVGLKDLFDAHYVDVPDEKVDVSNALAEKLAEAESKMNQIIEDNIQLLTQNEELIKDRMINDMSEGLVKTQAEKFRSLVEGFELDETFEDKMLVVKEKHFGVKPPKSTGVITEDVDEPLNEENVSRIDPVMQSYINASQMITRK
jgi:hypothetical protein